MRLKIASHWVTLQKDTSISIEMTSPLWNDSASFSYSFTVPYTPNRHIFNGGSLPEEEVNLANFSESFEYYTDGILLFAGKVACTSDSIDVESDTVEIELRGANDTFDEAMDKLSLQDIDLSENWMGETQKTEITYDRSGYREGKWWRTLKPSRMTAIKQPYNTSKIYPYANWVNIPIIVNGEERPLVLSPFRAFSAPCFYVLYIFNKLIKKTGFHVVSNTMEYIEDMKRLILLNTKFEHEKVYVSSTSSSEQIEYYDDLYYTKFTDIELSSLYASSKNLPDTEASAFFSSLKNAFGLRYIADEQNGIRFFLLRDVFRSTEVLSLDIEELISVTPIHTSFPGIKVSYGESEDKEFSYNDYTNVRVFNTYEELYDDWTSQVNDRDEFGQLILEFDNVLKIVKETGNYYRTKVDEQKMEDGEDADPQLFEVAQFVPYEVEGDESAEDETEEMTIDFSPMIPTAVQTTGSGKFTKLYDGVEMPDEAFYVDAEVTWKDGTKPVIEPQYGYGTVKPGFSGGIVDFPTSSSENQQYWMEKAETLMKEVLDYDCGFAMGVLRTTPEDSETGEYYSIVKDNVDGFGNDEWAVTVSTNAVTSDSITKGGAYYDYNGSGDGLGTSADQYISLKLWNCKQNFDPSNIYAFDSDGNRITGTDVYDNNPTGPLPNRGLVPQFLREYLHFRKHRKPISFRVYMRTAAIAAVRWDKYYTIDGIRGFIDKISFDDTANGISLVTIDFFAI